MTRHACSSQIQYLSKSTTKTTNTETAMLSRHDRANSGITGVVYGIGVDGPAGYPTDIE